MRNRDKYMQHTHKGDPAFRPRPVFPQLGSEGTTKPDTFNSNIYTYHKTRPQVSREGTRKDALSVEMTDLQM